MTSLFRPDRDWQSQEFIPTLRMGGSSDLPMPRGMLASDQTDPEASSSGFRSSSESAIDQARVLALEAWTPERIEALEQAAFARGVASAAESELDLARVCETLEASAKDLEYLALTSITANRALLLGLAIEIAQKWVGAELRLNPALIGDVLERAIRDWPGSVGACLQLHPADCALLLENQAERVAGWSQDYSLTVEEDASLALGEFRFDGARGGIDATLDSIREGLQDALGAALEADLPGASE